MIQKAPSESRYLLQYRSDSEARNYLASTASYPPRFNYGPPFINPVTVPKEAHSFNLSFNLRTS